MRIFEAKSRWSALAAASLLGLAVALIVGAFTDKAVAQNPGGGGSVQSYAVGGFTTLFSQEHVAFAAHSNPKKPGFYAGHVVQEYMDGTSNSGPVTCVNLFNSNQAVISFYVNNGVNQGTYRSFIVTDGGEPRMQTSPDAYQDCGQSGGGCDCQNGFNEPVVRGNIVVSP